MKTKRISAKRYCIGAAASLFVMLLLACSSLSATAAKVPDGFAEHFADVNGVRLHYLIGGKGNPVVLLHGYAQTSHMWNPIMPLLASNHTVIVPDLRGAGGSSKAESGYDKKNMAVDIHELVTSLGFKRASIVGHDIGLMVAYAYAAQFPQETERLVLMDAFLPGIGDWKNVWLMRDLWHFHFYGEVPLALVKGRERIYLEHFWNDFAADRKHSVSEADRQLYAKPREQGCQWLTNIVQSVVNSVVIMRCNNCSQPLNQPAIVTPISSAWAATASPFEKCTLVAHCCSRLRSPWSYPRLAKGLRRKRNLHRCIANCVTMKITRISAPFMATTCSIRSNSFR